MIRTSTWLALLILVAVHSGVFAMAQNASLASPRVTGEPWVLFPTRDSPFGTIDREEKSEGSAGHCSHPATGLRRHPPKTMLRYADSLAQVKDAQFTGERLSLVRDIINRQAWGPSTVLLIESLPFKTEREIATAWWKDLDTPCRVIQTHTRDEDPTKAPDEGPPARAFP